MKNWRAVLLAMMLLASSHVLAVEFSCRPTDWRGDPSGSHPNYRVDFAINAAELNEETVGTLNKVELVSYLSGGHGSGGQSRELREAFHATHPVYRDGNFFKLLTEYRAVRIGESAQATLRFDFRSNVHEISISRGSEFLTFFMVCDHLSN